jgi:hypothetical protein
MCFIGALSPNVQGCRGTNVITSASACALVYDNLAGQDRRSRGSTMGDLLATFALNANQRKPAIQALRRGVVP